MTTMLTLGQVSERLGLHMNTVRRYVDKGLIPAVKFEKAVRVEERDLERFIKGRKRKEDKMKEKEELTWLRDTIEKITRNITGMQEELEKAENQHAKVGVDSNWTGVENIPELEKIRHRIKMLSGNIESCRVDLKFWKEKKRRLIDSVFGLK